MGGLWRLQGLVTHYSHCLITFLLGSLCLPRRKTPAYGWGRGPHQRKDAPVLFPAGGKPLVVREAAREYGWAPGHLVKG